MKKKVIAGLMLVLVLASMLGMALNVTSIATEDTSNKILKEDFSEKQKANGANQPNEANKPNQPKAPDESWRDVFQNKEQTKSDHLEEGSSKVPLNLEEDKWNFQDTSEWNKFAYVDGNLVRLVVGIRDQKPNSYTELRNIAVNHEGKLINTVSIKGAIIAAVVEIPSKETSSFTTEIQDAEWASYIEPNMKFQAQLIPNDPYWSSQWGPQKIEADWAWNTTIGDPSVLVAVVDTGVDWDHPDLAANYVALGYDWVNNDPDPMDDHGHGTHVAGTIAAVLNNSIGVAGLAQVRIMAEKGLSSGGYGYEDWLANAIIHAVNQSADIISMSWGGYSHSELIYQAIKYAYDAGVLLVAAAGNEATSMKLYPAGYDEVIAVAATDRYDGRPSWSNFGEWVDLSAPGVDIYSTVWDNSYTYMSGTSMATPHVSGVAALIWSQFPNKTRDWVRLWLQYTADDLGAPGFDIYYGYGRINARKAVEQTPPDHELIAVSWKTPPYVEPGGSATINATILNFGANNETDIAVQLFANDSIVDFTSISFLASGESTTVSGVWNPTVEGNYNVTLYVVPVPGETIIENNILWKYIFVGFSLKAVVLDSAGTDLGEVISTWQALNNNWYLFGSTMIYIDYTTLNKEGITYEDIAATDADVLIISCAYQWEFTDAEIAAITRYVYEGHGLIATAGTLYYGVPNNNKLAPLFGLNETTTWGSTGTDLLHIEEPAHPLFRNIPNPFIFPQVGTSIPYDGIWDANELAGGTYVASGHFKESAIVTYRGLIFISPWLEIIPSYYHHPLQLLYNAITWSRYQKPEHELTVSLEVPRGLKPGKSVSLNATVSNMGLSNETNVELQLSIDGVLVNSITIPELWAGDSYTLNHLWTPTAEGIYNITVYALPVLGEDDITNNVKSVKVFVSALTVALFQNWNAWDYPSNQEALDRYGVPYVVFSSNDFGIVDLSGFTKVVVASDQDQAFYNGMDTYRWWFGDYVNNGGILEIHAADWGWHGGQWIGPLPGGLQRVSYYGQYVTIVDPTHPLLTTPNRITEGELDNWNYAVHGYFSVYPADAHVIIIEDSTRMPAYLEFRYGSGSIIASTQPLEWSYKRRFSLVLENSLLYMPIRYEHDIGVTLKAPDFLEPGGSVLLNATIRNLGLNNETNVELQLLINGTIVNSTIITELLIGQSYTLSHLWTPTLEGVYNVTAYAPPIPSEELIGNNIATKIVNVRYVPKLLVVDTPLVEDTGALDRLGYEYTLVSPTEFATINLYRFNVLFIGWMPGDVVANALLARASDIASWVSAGNGIVALSEFYETNRWAWLPLWVNSSEYHADNVHILDLTHPVMFNLTDAELSYWGNSYHGYFGSYHSDWNALAQGVEAGYPITLAATYGNGRIAITQQDPDYHFYYGYQVGAGKLLRNMIEWATPYGRHDVAVIDVTASATEVYVGQTINITVTVKNEGNYSETFNVGAYYDSALIGTQTLTDFAPDAVTTLLLSWNTTNVVPRARNPYPMKAAAQIVAGETDIADNTYVYGAVKVKILGDTNGDGEVDGVDLTDMGFAWGSKIGDVNYDPNVDFNFDGTIDGSDLTQMGFNWGYIEPEFVIPWPSGTVVYSDPWTIQTTRVGETFTVQILAKDFADLYTWQAGLTWDPTVLEALTVYMGPTLPDDVFDGWLQAG